MKKTKKELEEELRILNKEGKRLDVEDKVKEKRLSILKRRYTGIKTVIRFFKK